jgi:hypothetical protein
VGGPPGLPRVRGSEVWGPWARLGERRGPVPSIASGEESAGARALGRGHGGDDGLVGLGEQVEPPASLVRATTTP